MSHELAGGLVSLEGGDGFGGEEVNDGHGGFVDVGGCLSQTHLMRIPLSTLNIEAIDKDTLIRWPLQLLLLFSPQYLKTESYRVNRDCLLP